MTIRRVAIYARTAVSQGGEYFALLSQIDQCKAYAVAHGCIVDAQHIYQEAYSGAVDYNKRQQLTALREAAKRHEFDTVIITSFDRLSRNSVHQVAIFEDLKQLGVTIESIQEPLEASAVSELINSVHAHIGKIERERRGERIRRGRAVARQKREQQ